LSLKGSDWNTGERREGDKGTKGAKERKKKCRYEINHSLSNLNVQCACIYKLSSSVFESVSIAVCRLLYSKIFGRVRNETLQKKLAY
jgi:hypothetical protein